MVNIEKESDIQNAICEYLARKKYFFWRSNNTPISDIRNGKRFFRSLPKYARHGVPDIIVIHKGLFMGIEVKTAIGKQSDHQKEFEKDCRENGGAYSVVRSIDDCIKLGL